MIQAGHQHYQEEELVNALWEALDTNHDNTLDVKELLVGLSVLSEGDLDHKLKLGFRIYDLNKDGFIQREELAVLVRAISQVHYSNTESLEIFIKEFVDQTFAKYDANGDNKLSFEEWCEAAKENEEVRSFFTLKKAHLT
eukprot:TRINITY_DN12057_c0_g1_i2.p1 TRINITY_DN12057_c0_g1~~TRINITY_DN12057_c0_g1_i2.p1  ORF type:complete len:140 (+),score=33.75 TRINITY_DN12057_c0_g1_i2:355-774(+)